MTLRVIEGRFLGYVITKEGIKLHHEKIRAIVNMKTPAMIKEIQQLNRSITTLNRFLPKSVEKFQPFYELLKTMRKTIKLGPTCEDAFNRLKKVLTQLPVLHSPENRRNPNNVCGKF